MKNYFSFILLSSFLLWSQLASAGRILRMVPIDTPTGWASGPLQGACMIGFSRIFSFVNLGDDVQNITIRNKNIRANFATCVNSNVNIGSSNWTLHAGHCWGRTETSLPTEISITLQPTQAGSVSFTFSCHVRKSGVMYCTTGEPDYVNITPAAERQSQNVLTMGEATHEIEIEQSRGAVIGSVIAQGISSCNELKNNTKHNIPINGGKAF